MSVSNEFLEYVRDQFREWGEIIDNIQAQGKIVQSSLSKLKKLL